MQPAETDINLEISFSEQAVNLKNNSVSDVLKDKEDDTLLPVSVYVCICMYLTKVIRPKYFSVHELTMT